MNLDLEEYVEQAHFYSLLHDRLPKNIPLQELLLQAQDEVLSTTKLPMAIDFMLSEIRHAGTCHTAMAKLPHYFSPFQVYVIQEAENDRGRMDMRTAALILQREAEYRAAAGKTAGVFMYQFETLCRNRLSYDHGLGAMAGDPLYGEAWKEWILAVRRQVGIIDLADLIYVRSEYCRLQTERRGKEFEHECLFGEKEGKIAFANRRKDPLFLFAALQRHLGYPKVPIPPKIDRTPDMIPQLSRRIEQLEHRLKLLEEENKGGIDITKFYQE